MTPNAKIKEIVSNAIVVLTIRLLFLATLGRGQCHPVVLTSSNLRRPDLRQHAFKVAAQNSFDF